MEFVDFPKGGMDRPRTEKPSKWEKAKEAVMAEIAMIFVVVLLSFGVMAAWYESACRYQPR